MKQRTAGRGDSERLRRALSELRQQNEQLRVKRESAEQEIALAAAQSAALEATIAGLRNESLHQRHAILELQAELVRREASESDLSQERDSSVGEGELLRKELAVTSEELGASDQELVKANAALIERTAELAKVVLQLSQTVAQRDALLEEQSLLAREVDHRVKNSLQMVTSLLAMQAAAAHAESEQRALQLAAMRVQAIAHAHGLLYRAGGSDSVSFQDYLAALCRDLKAALAPETGREIDCQAEAIQVPPIMRCRLPSS